jgi:isopentenyl phosphate kinase
MVSVLKLGGSVLTYKTRWFSFQEETALRLAMEIREAGTVPVIVYGTGSFGKAYARHYRQGQATADWGVFQLTTAAIRELGENLSRALHAQGVPHCLLPANAFFFRRDGQLGWDGPAPLDRLLRAGVAPVLCGDVLAEGRDRFRIISSDDIIPILAADMAVSSCVFVTDVDGVLDERGMLVAERSGAQQQVAVFGDQDDITGAMDAKLAAAVQSARAGTQAIIVNGLVPGRLRAALRGEQVTGTRVTTAALAAVPAGR